MRNNNKIILLMLILSVFLLIAGIIIISRQDDSSNDNYKFVRLSLKMPLSNDEEYTNNLINDLTDSLEKNEWGYITGRGPILSVGIRDTYEVNFSIKDSAITDFKNYIVNFDMAMGSYLEVEGKVVKKYGNWYCFEVVYNKDKSYTANIESELTRLLDNRLMYKITYTFNEKKYIYLFGPNEKELEIGIHDYIDNVGLAKEVSITKK